MLLIGKFDIKAYEEKDRVQEKFCWAGYDKHG